MIDPRILESALDDLHDVFVQITLQDALELAAWLGFVRQEERGRLLVAILGRGVEIAWQSECGGPYSDVTPELDWEPPTIFVRRTETE